MWRTSARSRQPAEQTRAACGAGWVSGQPASNGSPQEVERASALSLTPVGPKTPVVSPILPWGGEAHASTRPSPSDDLLGTPSAPSTAEPTSRPTPSLLSDVEDFWSSQNCPTEVPVVFREIWNSVGYSNRGLKYALLALCPAWTGLGVSGEAESRRVTLEFYSLALRTTREEPISLTNAPSVGMLLTILSIFMLIEMKHGNFIGGFAHYKQAAVLVAENFGPLSCWPLGRRLLCYWMSIKCWYSVQLLPWGDRSSSALDVHRQLRLASDMRRPLWQSL